MIQTFRGHRFLSTTASAGPQCLPRLPCASYERKRTRQHGVVPTSVAFRSVPFRSVPYPVADKGPRFRAAWEKPLHEPGWSRAWGAFHESGIIVGHADIRARAEPCTNHRALLGVGCDSNFRNQGIAKQLVQIVMNWAAEQQTIEWLDLHMLGGNAPARAVYDRLGFYELVSVPDMFRIDGQSVDDVIMTKRIR